MTDREQPIEERAADDFRETPAPGALLHTEDGIVWMKTVGATWLRLGDAVELGHEYRLRES